MSQLNFRQLRDSYRLSRTPNYIPLFCLLLSYTHYCFPFCISYMYGIKSIHCITRQKKMWTFHWKRCRSATDSRKLFTHFGFWKPERRIHIPWICSSSVLFSVKSTQYALSNGAKINSTMGTRIMALWTQSQPRSSRMGRTIPHKRISIGSDTGVEEADGQAQ